MTYETKIEPPQMSGDLGSVPNLKKEIQYRFIQAKQQHDELVMLELHHQANRELGKMIGYQDVLDWLDEFWNE